MSDGDAAFAGAEARKAFGGILASLDCLMVNDPAKVAVAEYKALQQQTARQVGLSIPATLVTNDHAAVAEFAERCGTEIICKPMSSLTLSERGEWRSVYATPVHPSDIDPAELAVTAHLIQEWVPKAYEARVMMVGRRPFGVAIHACSDNAYVDWRSDYSSLRYGPVEPPADVTATMSAYLAALGLSFGAFDFVITPDDQWIMLECNPDGMWLWLNDEAATPIAAGMADLLTEGKLA